jgi:hypothetical protein
MSPILINPLSLILTLATSFGVLLHDTQLDRATSISLALPTTFATIKVNDISIKLSDPHLHVELISYTENIDGLRLAQPRIQPRSGEEKRYVASKKFSSDTEGSEYIWPSV